MDLIRQTLPYCVRLRSQYLVFHHNNIPVTEERREEMIRVSRENYREIAELFKPHQIPVVVENAGVLDRGTCCLTRMRLSSSAGKSIIPC